MSIQVALHHRTTYRYDRPVALGPQTIRLRPAPHCRSRILGYSLKVTPGEHFVNWQQDPQANWLARLVFPERTSSLEIDVALVAEMTAVNPFDFFLEPSAEMWPFAYDPAIAPDLAPYRRTLPGSPLFDAFVAGISRTPRATNHLIVELNQLVSQQIAYGVRLEAGLQTPEETLEKKGGSCRDSSWLLVQVLRQLGFATRFASGYLIQLTSDTKPLDDGAAGPTSDFVDLHAWCEVYLPGAGWIGLDPTSGLLAGEGHLPLACTADPSQAAPVSGLVESCNTTFEHEMTISRILETPRVTKPYTDRQWAAVLAAGQAIDRELEAADVRLTMGGEPTFVSIDDFDGDEWNIDAMGDAKKKLSVELHGRLKERYAPNGLVHFGQGKWYPGEPLPRWALNLFWRADGEALWTDASLVADESKPSGATEAQAAALLRGVAKRLGLDDRLVFPAFEDAPYYRWREGKLPSNVDAIDPKLDDALERDRLKKTFMAGIDAVIGHVLPVGRKHEVWRSGSWHFRNDRCFLVPGDSPIGLRLPLDSQPWIAPGDRDPIDVPDPSADHEELPSHDALLDGAKGKSDDARAPKKGESAKWVTRTAMCAEPRKGVLYVFMPPMEALDDYVILVAAVEAAAKEIGVPVLLEGYSPPRDPRVVSMSVTPDPGVIEVNVQPSKSWNELVDHTTHLYETARITRLSAEKFTVDGRHVGTGGGNHMVLGGATPEDSPFLRRPDLLRSIIAYFHQHPSLSYLFSGQFIGPTSQAPRLDEARNDAIAEIEIAFAEVTRKTGEQPPTPWLVDRLFRDLLTDVTGNTHRAELCIDKLYSPTDRRGASACSRCAPSKCRRTRACRSRSSCSCARSSRGSGRRRTRRSGSRGGAPSSTIASCSPSSSGRTSRASSPISARTVMRSSSIGSARTSSSVFRSTATSSPGSSRSSSAARSSPGT